MNAKGRKGGGKVGATDARAVAKTGDAASGRDVADGQAVPPAPSGSAAAQRGHAPNPAQPLHGGLRAAQDYFAGLRIFGEVLVEAGWWIFCLVVAAAFAWAIVTAPIGCRSAPPSKRLETVVRKVSQINGICYDVTTIEGVRCRLMGRVEPTQSCVYSCTREVQEAH